MTSTNPQQTNPPDRLTKKYERLHEKIDKTARSRFAAARRCELNELFSLYTVVIISCCIIGLTLFDALQMLEPEASKLSAFLQVFCAVAVLSYSIILSKSDFALQAYKHHECGMALNKLKNNVYKHILENPGADQFLNSSKQYATVLEKYDNHQNIDFYQMVCRNKEYHELYGVNACYRFRVWCCWLLGFWHYFIFSAVAILALVSIYCRYGD